MTDRRTILTVVCFLGLLATLLVSGQLWLIHDLIHEAKPDTAAIALVTGVSTLAGSTIGALGAMLVSTRSTPSNAEVAQALSGLPQPEPVEVVGEGGGPVKTETAKT